MHTCGREKTIRTQKKKQQKNTTTNNNNQERTNSDQKIHASTALQTPSNRGKRSTLASGLTDTYLPRRLPAPDHTQGKPSSLKITMGNIYYVPSRDFSAGQRGLAGCDRAAGAHSSRITDRAVRPPHCTRGIRAWRACTSAQGLISDSEIQARGGQR